MLWRSHIENIVTLIVTSGTILGLYYMGAGSYSFWALIMLLNINSPRGKDTSATETEKTDG